MSTSPQICRRLSSGRKRSASGPSLSRSYDWSHPCLHCSLQVLSDCAMAKQEQYYFHRNYYSPVLGTAYLILIFCNRWLITNAQGFLKSFLPSKITRQSCDQTTNIGFQLKIKFLMVKACYTLRYTRLKMFKDIHSSSNSMSSNVTSFSSFSFSLALVSSRSFSFKASHSSRIKR